MVVVEARPASEQLLGSALALALALAEQLPAPGPGLLVVTDELLGQEASHDLDELQVLLDVCGLDVGGVDCADWPWQQGRTDGHDHCVDGGRGHSRSAAGRSGQALQAAPSLPTLDRSL
jgi:hypothetical protein